LQTALPAGLGFHTAAVVCSEDLVGLCAGGAKPGKTVFDGECYRMTDAQVAAWPAIDVVLGKDPESQATVTVAPQAYLRECGNGRGSVPPLRASVWLLLRARQKLVRRPGGVLDHDRLEQCGGRLDPRIHRDGRTHHRL